MFFFRKKIKFYYFILLTSLFITFVYNLKFLKILYGKIGFSSFPSIYFFFAIIIAIICNIPITTAIIFNIAIIFAVICNIAISISRIRIIAICNIIAILQFIAIIIAKNSRGPRASKPLWHDNMGGTWHSDIVFRS